jgi:Zn-dependent protease with chaperone function
MTQDRSLDRRDFMKISGMAGVGAMVLNMSTQVMAQGNTELPKEQKQLKFWLDSLMKRFREAQADTHCADILAGCGSDCANNHQMEAFARKIRGDIAPQNVEAVLAAVNQKNFGVQLKQENGFIYSSYNQCYCPIRKSGWVSDPQFCNCTVGWNQVFVGALLDMPVKAELIQSIGRGDANCVIKIRV